MYELRAGTKQIFYYSVLGQREIKEFLKYSESHPDEDVRIIEITENIILNRYGYELMKAHFETFKKAWEKDDGG